MKENLVVIARYDEDLDWVNDLRHSILIYNKGDEFPFKFERKDVPNRGREPETYLRAIIENYHLLDQFDSVVFLQGNPYDHFVGNINEKINNFNDDNFSSICEGYGNVAISNNLYINGIHYDLLRVFLLEKYVQETGSHKCIYLLNFLGIELSSAHWNYSCGAQYIVPVRQILNKSLDWWKNSYRVYDYYIRFNSGDPALLFEFIWPMIWSHQEKI
jgi:hypothetical protein